MGIAQSSPRHRASPPSPASAQPIQPYGLSPLSDRIQLNPSYRALYSGIISLVQNNKYADLLIICGSDRYPVHRAIVCPRSHFFEEQCAARNGECDYASPAKPTKIWIDPSECDSHVLAAVLTFLYTLDYSTSGPQVLTFGLPEAVEEEIAGEADNVSTIGGGRDSEADEEASVVSEADMESMATSENRDHTPSPSPSLRPSQASAHAADPGEPPNELAFHVQMYCAGHRFGVIPLCDVSAEKLLKRLQSGPWKTEMMGCIREVYKRGDDNRLAWLRETVVKSARSRFRVLKTMEGWDDLIVESPEFAKQLLRRL